MWWVAHQSLAVDISLAALLGENVYNFGELLLHPIVRTAAPYPFTRRRASCVAATSASALSCTCLVMIRTWHECSTSDRWPT